MTASHPSIIPQNLTIWKGTQWIPSRSASFNQWKWTKENDDHDGAKTATWCSYYDINSELASLLQYDLMVQKTFRQLLNRLPIIWAEWFNLCWYTWIKPGRFATMIVLHNISNWPFNFSQKLWDHFSFIFLIIAFLKSAVSQFISVS